MVAKCRSQEAAKRHRSEMISQSPQSISTVQKAYQDKKGYTPLPVQVVVQMLTREVIDNAPHMTKHVTHARKQDHAFQHRSIAASAQKSFSGGPSILNGRRSSRESLDSKDLCWSLSHSFVRKHAQAFRLDAGRENRSWIKMRTLDHSEAVGALKIRHLTARYSTVAREVNRTAYCIRDSNSSFILLTSA